MKKTLNIVLIGIVLTISSNLLAQEKIKDIIIDFDTKEINTTDIKRIKEGEFFRLVIRNINLNIYKISINKKDTITSKPIEMPSFSSFGIDAISKTISSLEASSMSMLADNKNFNDDKIIHMSDTYRKIIDNEYTIIIKTNKNLSKLLSELNLISAYVFQYQLKAFDESKKTSVFNYENTSDSILFKVNALTNLKTEIETNKNLFFNTLINNNYDTLKNITTKEHIKQITNEYNSLITTINIVMTEINLKETNKLLKEMIFLSNNSTEYISLPMQLNGEQTILEYEITPRDNIHYKQSFKSSISFPKNYSYYSIGFAFYGTKSLFDNSYSTIGTPTSDTTSVFNIIKEDNSESEIGLSSLFRFGSKIRKSDFGIHLNTGVGISISNNIKPRLLFGMGFSYGKRHNFAVDFGGIAGYVNVLSNAFEENIQYSEKPENITISKLKLGMYFSIGYYYKF